MAINRRWTVGSAAASMTHTGAPVLQASPGGLSRPRESESARVAASNSAASTPGALQNQRQRSRPLRSSGIQSAPTTQPSALPMRDSSSSTASSKLSHSASVSDTACTAPSSSRVSRSSVTSLTVPTNRGGPASASVVRRAVPTTQRALPSGLRTRHSVRGISPDSLSARIAESSAGLSSSDTRPSTDSGVGTKVSRSSP